MAPGGRKKGKKVPSGPVADKPCHNCRRRRLRCDRLLPHCAKCEAKGVDCLGYSQIFQWTGAVASRGRLAGQQSSAALYTPARPTTARSRASLSSVSSLSSNSPASSSSASSIASPSVPSSSPAFIAPALSQVDEVTETSEAESESGSELDIFNDNYIDDQNNGGDDDATPLASGDTQLVCTTNNNYPLASETSTPWVLVDPLYQDITSNHRQYLAYFDARLSRDFVAYDVPDNPFRNLLKFTQAQPLLRQVIIAASATHMYNRSRPWLSSDSLDRGLGPRNLLMDALEAKHQVLRMLPSALQSIESIGGDIVLAAILFLINVELIESGKHNWKTHFDGAGKIMKLLGPVSDVDESLRDYIVSDCFIYYILESTFRPTASDSHSYFDSCEALKILGKTSNSYYCCPPELLEIMLIAARLSNTKNDDVVSADMVTAAGAALLDRARNFDVLPWAQDINFSTITLSDQDPILSRFRVATSHRLAICLYILNAIPAVGAWVGEDLADAVFAELHQVLCMIPDDDINLKATTWVTFVFGACARTPEMKDWVTVQIKKLMIESPWGFLYAARDALQMLWSVQAEGMPMTSWVQTLRDLHMDFLIV
ncbi:fungal-specific transcription factor domain-containing protein [Fusarium flagelliforme]|uniref:fungal-specific transcription factor domain-containing protein n=1 Tax=Fusarium flagelliforme TaxID=2675880 RepID=UPI001E8E1523|nr:fungal-specific transcription factor domain-containing protein [Fusarium flagelliforme]KAH7185924.1 fungal-specific transcription factor domain-containing protein [Fusarium flagelliforme]